MKKIIAIACILSISFGSALFAGNNEDGGNAPVSTSITGKVIDKGTMEELAGVSVQIEGTDIKAYTDIEGNFLIEGLKPGTYDLNISYISYKETELPNISVKAESNEIEIKLEQID